MIISYDKDKNKAEVLRETDSSDNSWIIHVDVIDENPSLEDLFLYYFDEKISF